MFRFKRKCHEFGHAIEIRDGFFYVCFCLEGKELGRIYELGFQQGWEEAENEL